MITTVEWFSVDPNDYMRDAAAEILDWLDEQSISYKWLGQGRRESCEFKVAIGFERASDAVLARLRWG